MKKKLPSTWPLDPQHGTLDPRPSTLDKKIDSTKCIWVQFALLEPRVRRC